MANRLLNLLVGTLALATGLFIAGHHPLAYPLPIILFAIVAAVGYRWPGAWLVALPTLMPVIGFAPWSGWLTFEETDLLVLAFAAGGYFRAGTLPIQGATPKLPKRLIVLATLTCLALAIAMVRGFNDAGGFQFGWFQGYNGPMNSVRIGKSIVLALLLIPLFQRLLLTSSHGAATKLSLGLVGAFTTASVVTLWERLAFTDLLNFSSDYRTTGPFWEMHVGGAALDGWLVLTAPFALWALLNARTHLHWSSAALLLAIGAYASLTTFSRGVYLALVISLVVLGILVFLQRRAAAKNYGAGLHAGHWAFAITVLATISSLIFPSSGYRGLLALLGIIAISLPAPSILKGLNRRGLLLGTLSGAVLGLILVISGGILPKGPYLLYSLAVAVCASAVTAHSRTSGRLSGIAYLASFIATCFAATNVAAHWGGESARSDFMRALIILVAGLLLAMWRIKPPRWPSTLRTQGSALIVCAAVFGATSIFGGGAYMSERFSTSNQDLGGRIEHWRQTIGLLNTPLELTFGKGLGRFPANYFFAIPKAAFPGTYLLSRDDSGPFLRLSGAHHPISFGDLFRISQRLSLNASGPFSARIKVRSDTAISLHLEVCEKHLLYAARCHVGKAVLKEPGPTWQTLAVTLESASFSDAPWYAPRFKMFSIGLESQGKIADIGEISLASPQGTNLIANGDFRNEMAHWFFSSDRDHMPWHAKSMIINQLFDQGIMGLSLLAALIFVTLWRLNVGKGKHHPLAPYVSAGIIGLVVVGLFDSLLDVPRLALLFYLVSFSALSFGGHQK